MVASSMSAWLSAVDSVSGRAPQWERYYSYIFDGIDMDGKTVIDIGAGLGIAGCYAAAQGARQVTLLEPEGAGSRPDVLSRAQRLANESGVGGIVKVLPKRLDEVNLPDYDVVLVHNTINHFDEAACSALDKDPEARERYLAVFRQLADVSKAGGLLIIADCSNKNLFAKLGVRNPFAPTINWKIHQPPEIWEELGAAYGFERFDLRWTWDRRLPKPLAPRFGARTVAYLTHSHFCLRLRRPAVPRLQ